MSDFGVAIIGQSREISVVTRATPKIKAVHSTLIIDRNDHFLSISGFGNKIHIKQNFGRVELVGQDNELTIERDYTNWVGCKGRNSITIGSVLLEEGRRHLENDIDNCTICYNQYHLTDTNIEIMKCKHAMHKECFSQYTVRFSHCPLCKTHV